MALSGKRIWVRSTFIAQEALHFFYNRVNKIHWNGPRNRFSGLNSEGRHESSVIWSLDCILWIYFPRVCLDSNLSSMGINNPA